MAIDENTVRRVANLSRIQIESAEVAPLSNELSSVLDMLDSLQEVDVDGIEPLTSVVPTNAPMREDDITDGNRQQEILKNAPLEREGFFAVPKVVE